MSETPRTNALKEKWKDFCLDDHGGVAYDEYEEWVDLAEQLESKLARYEMAEKELPEEPSHLNLTRFWIHGGATEVVLASYYDKLRAQLVTVMAELTWLHECADAPLMKTVLRERDAARERAEKAEAKLAAQGGAEMSDTLPHDVDSALEMMRFGCPPDRPLGNSDVAYFERRMLRAADIVESSLTAANERLEKAEAWNELNVRDGNFLDKMGCCKVCDGEIPDGHAEHCDIWKVEKRLHDFIANEYNTALHRAEAAERQRDEMLVALNLGKRRDGESPVQTIMRLNDAERSAEENARDGEMAMDRIFRAAHGYRTHAAHISTAAAIFAAEAELKEAGYSWHPEDAPKVRKNAARHGREA